MNHLFLDVKARLLLGISPASDGRDDPVFSVGLEGGGGPLRLLYLLRSSPAHQTSLGACKPSSRR